MAVTASTIFSTVKDYLKSGRELQAHLLKYPNDWPRFQSTFNSTLDKVYNDIMQFEKENIYKFESRVYKLKKIIGDFIKNNNVNFFQKNAVRLALKKNIHDEIPRRYDLIYSTWLFDILGTSCINFLTSLRM